MSSDESEEPDEQGPLLQAEGESVMRTCLVGTGRAD
jgi:hypothetical protein